MAGKIHKANYMYRPWRWFTFVPDWTSIRLWLSRSRRDNRDDSLTLCLVKEFAQKLIELRRPFEVDHVGDVGKDATLDPRQIGHEPLAAAQG